MWAITVQKQFCCRNYSLNVTKYVNMLNMCRHWSFKKKTKVLNNHAEQMPVWNLVFINGCSCEGTLNPDTYFKTWRVQWITHIALCGVSGLFNSVLVIVNSCKVRLRRMSSCKWFSAAAVGLEKGPSVASCSATGW